MSKAPLMGYSFMSRETRKRFFRAWTSIRCSLHFNFELSIGFEMMHHIYLVFFHFLKNQFRCSIQWRNWQFLFHLQNGDIIELSFNFPEFTSFECAITRWYGRNPDGLLEFVWSIKSVEFVRQSFNKHHIDTSRCHWKLRGKLKITQLSFMIEWTQAHFRVLIGYTKTSTSHAHL